MLFSLRLLIFGYILSAQVTCGLTMELEPLLDKNKSRASKSIVEEDHNSLPIRYAPHIFASEDDLDKFEAMELEEACKLSEEVYELNQFLAVAKSQRRVNEIEQKLSEIKIEEEEDLPQKKRLIDLDEIDIQTIELLSNNKLQELMEQFKKLSHPELIAQLKLYIKKQLADFDINSRNDMKKIFQKLKYNEHQLTWPQKSKKEKKITYKKSSS